MLALGGCFSLEVAIDGYGNFAIQFSHAGTGVENFYVGVPCYGGVSETASFMWEANSIYDLEEQTMINYGMDKGFGASISGDVILMPEAENVIGGVSVSKGVGTLLDSHVYSANTKNLVTYNVHNNEFNFGNPKNKIRGNITKTAKTTATNKFCTYCGKPIGNKPWQCSGGWM